MKACLYSTVKDVETFKRVGFYRDDLAALKMRSERAIVTNSVRELLRFRPDVIVGYFYSKSILAALVGRLIGARVLLTGGADQISPAIMSGYRLFIHRVIAFHCLLLAHRILLSCADDIANYRRLCFGFQFLEKKLNLVNHVVTSSPLVRSLSADRSGHFSAFTMCWMGSERNVRRKGVDRSIKLISLLRENGVNATLDIAGIDGPGRILVEKLIRDLDLAEYVHFLGAISEGDKNRRMAQGGVYLQLSEYEGFGVAAAEALFSGMIVVHSNKGGLRDVIGERGLIVELAMIDDSDLAAVRGFYSRFLHYEVNTEILKKDIDNYSIGMRSNAFYSVD